MDIEMPVLDGIAATQAIRAREKLQKDPLRLPILGVTGRPSLRSGQKPAQR